MFNKLESKVDEIDKRLKDREYSNDMVANISNEISFNEVPSNMLQLAGEQPWFNWNLWESNI
jgi:hypothetical protein